jgi:hypothetical protein
MSVQIIHHHPYQNGIWEVAVHQVTHAKGELYLGAMSGHHYLLPVLKRGKEHEQIAHSVAHILVIHPRWEARCHRQWQPALLD